MKKKVLFIIIFFSIVVAMQFLLINSVNAALIVDETDTAEIKKYDDNFNYYEIEDGTYAILASNKNMTTANIPANINGKKVTKIGIQGFYDCKNLKSVTIPNTIKIIGKEAFWNCSSLTNIDIPNSVTTIDTRAFEACISLQKITIPNSVTELGWYVFFGCSKLTEVNLPNTIAELNGTFYACTSLKSVKIPESVTSMESTFDGCRALTSVKIPSKVTTLKETFASCKSLKSIVIPNTVKEITWFAFAGCFALTSIDIPSSVTTIGYSAFSACNSLTDVIIPNTVTEIDSAAFYGCESLRTVVLPDNLSYLDSHTFKECPNVTLYVNTGTSTESCLKQKGIPYKDLKEKPSFIDVKKSDWFYNAVEYCNNNKIITGYGQGRFAPNDELSRGMLVTILYKMEGQPKVTGKSKFTDVQNTKDYYYNAVIWASNNNVVSGYKNKKFGPNDSITREDLAVILNRYAKFKGKNTNQISNLNGFTDTDQISSYAVEQVKWAVGAGVISGNANKTLAPKGQSSRAEAAAMIEKYCKKVGR